MTFRGGKAIYNDNISFPPGDVCLSYSLVPASAPLLKGAIQLCILDKNENRPSLGSPCAWRPWRA